jgi:integrase
MGALLNAARHPPQRAKRSGGPSAEPWFYPAVAFAIYTGARRGEVLGLRWSDVDFESDAVTIRRSLTRTHSLGLLQGAEERQGTHDYHAVPACRNPQAAPRSARP